MPSLPRVTKGDNPAGLTPSQAVRRGLRVNEGIMQFEFKPTVGISARDIDRIGIDIRSFREPLKRVIQKVMAPSFRKNFEVGGRPDSWDELSEATLDIRSRMGFGGAKPLQRSGTLMRTMQQLNIWTITETTATIRDLPEKIWYGKIQQAGIGHRGGGTTSMTEYLKESGSAREAQQRLDDKLVTAMRTGKALGWGGTKVAIPPRPFVVIQDEDYDEIERIFTEWMLERAAAAGFVGAGGL
jgi:phage gpG-like protein